MCGRFTMAIDAERLQASLSLGKMPEEWPKRYNIAPSQEIAVVADSATRDVVWMRWGLVPFWAKDPSIGYKMINARAETVAEKPAYKAAFRNKRCLILADGFYEWQKTSRGSEPHYFSSAKGEPFAFAGLWDIWEQKGVSSMPGIPGLITCTIITTDANEDVSPVHERMPVILSGQKMWDWLEADSELELLSLLTPPKAGLLKSWAVSRDVNSPKIDAENLIKPISSGTLFD